MQLLIRIVVHLRRSNDGTKSLASKHPSKNMQTDLLNYKGDSGRHMSAVSCPDHRYLLIQ
jgi:hypothetical protein